jgi:hypothetical protein
MQQRCCTKLRRNKMTTYQAKINKTSLFAYIVQIDNDKVERVCNDFKARHFSTYEKAVKATSKYIALT